jgi:hypothetical protein
MPVLFVHREPVNTFPLQIVLHNQSLSPPITVATHKPPKSPIPHRYNLLHNKSYNRRHSRMTFPHATLEFHELHIVHENWKSIQSKIQRYCFLPLVSLDLNKIELPIRRREAGQREKSLWLGGEMSVQRFRKGVHDLEKSLGAEF